MDWGKMAEKALDRVFILGLTALAIWWAGTNSSVTRVQKLEEKLESSLVQINQFAQQVQKDIGEIKALPKK